MEIKVVNKTEFTAIAKKNKQIRQFMIDNGIVYEQLTVDDIQFRHRLLSVRLVSMEMLDKKAQVIQPGALPIRLKDSAQGDTLAFICCGKTALFYHLPIDTKEKKNRAQQIVFSYAKSLVNQAA